MNFRFGINNLTEVLRQLEEAIAWLRKLNVNCSASRITLYRTHIQKLIRSIESGTLTELLESAGEQALINSLYEISTINTIYQGLKSIEATPGLINRLNELILGTTDVRNEGQKPSSHKGRDTSFELIMASFFSQAAYSINIDTDADLLASNQNISLIIECKRPRSSHSLRGALKSAKHQLANRYNTISNKNNSYGVIAISIDIIVNPQHFYLLTSDSDSINNILTKEAYNFIHSNLSLWRTILHNNTLGVLALLRTIAIVRDVNMIATCSFMTGTNLHIPGSPQTLFFKTISNDLTNVMTTNQS
jgi:hypothetical protein